MKKFNFSLEKMHDFKEQMLEKEKNTLSQLSFQRTNIENKIEDLEDFLKALDIDLQKRVSKGTTIMMIQGHRFQMENIRSQISDLNDQLEKLAPIIERQREIVVEASQEVSGLDKLKEKQLTDYNKGVQKAEETKISEFITMSLFREPVAR